MAAVPKREDELLWDRSKNGNREKSAVTKGVRMPVTSRPSANLNWADWLQEYYNALGSSGQSVFYQNTDWHHAYFVFEQLDAHVKSGMRSAVLFQALNSALISLLVTEGERRRVRIELDAPPGEGKSASVVAMENAKRRLGVVK